jgi:purine-binding chemotaxis protein CheW
VAVGGRPHAFPLASVREIVPLGRTARIPGAAAHVLGLVNVRGRLVTTVDLGLRLGGAAVDRAEASVLLVEDGERVVGAAVDALVDVVQVAAADVRPTPAAPGTRPGDAMTAGVVPFDGGDVPVLAPEALVRETLG